MMGSMLRRGALTADTTGGGPPSPSWTLDFSTSTPSGYTLTRASSATRVDSSGYIASSATDVARLTHNSSGSRLGLLVEGQRTNNVRNTENMSVNMGSVSGATVNLDDGTAPDNQVTADRVELTSSGFLYKSSSNALAAGTYTASFYIKQKSASQSVGVRFASTMTTITTSANWQRVETTVTTSSSGTIEAGIDQRNFLGGPGTACDVLIWGFQIEEGNKATSYIPNRTATASVTRSADIAYLGAVTNFGRPGSFVVEYYKPIDPNGHVLVAQDDVGSGGRLGLAYSSGGPRIIFGTTSGGSGATDTAGLNKVGWAWDGSGAATRSAINGAAWNTSLATSFDPSTVTSIGLGGNVSDPGTLPITVSEQPNVIVRKITFYNSQLSAADLNTLTT